MRRERIGAFVRYILAAALLVLLSAVTGDVLAFAASAFFLTLPWASLLSGLYVRRRITGRLLLATTAAKETAIQGTLWLKNEAWLPAVKLYCLIGIQNDLTGEKCDLELSAAIGAKRQDSRAILLESACCGRVYVYLRSVRLMDYFGMFSLNVPVKASGRTTVLPELIPSEITISTASATLADEAAARRGDDRTEIFQLREYQSGDDIRQIHWKLSSKVDSLLFKQPGQSVSHSLLVFWDKRHPCPAKSMDAMAEVTASVCQGLSEGGITFDLCWTQGDELELRQLHDREALLPTIPALVTQAGTMQCPVPDFSRYGKVIYITGVLPEENENTTYLLCGESVEGAHCVSFSPDNYRQIIERLEL